MFTDALIMDKTWDVPGGFLGFSARFARTGVQMYDGSEIDPAGIHKDAAGARKFNPGTLYPVDRPAEEVFKPSAMASFIAKPLTNDHPADGVTINDWNAKTKGVIGEVLRDGEFARLSGLMTDKGLIADFRAGKKDLSGGYEANLVVRDGVNPAGEAYVAQQTDIGGNHVAFVTHGRAGNTRVADAAPCQFAPQSFLDSLKPQEKPVPKIILVDGLSVDVSNPEVAESTIKTVTAQRDTATAKVATIDTELTTLKAEVTTKDAKIATLEQAVKDAKPTPAQLRDAGKALMIVAGQAKALGVTVTDAMDEGAIMKAVVDAKMGDKAKDWNDAQIGASFAVLAKDVKVTDAPAISGTPINMGDAQTQYEDSQAKRKQELRDAWKTPANSNAVAA